MALASDKRKLPRSGIELSAMGLGCAQLGGLYQAISDAEAHAIVDEAWSAGIRYFDTAPYYGYTLSELRLGSALRERDRDSYVISTKAGRLMRLDAGVQPGENGWARPLPFRPHFDYTYDGIMRSHQDSLRRLCLDRVDILYVHDIGQATHGSLHNHYWKQLTHGGGFRALTQLRDGGSVGAIGLGVNEWKVVADAIEACDIDCALLAGRYTLLEQAARRPLLDLCAERGIGIIIGGPFNSGILAGTRKFNYEDAPARIVARVEAIESVCREHSVPIQAAALQFPMAHPAVVSCVAGAHSPEQLRQNSAWFAQQLPHKLWQDLVRRGLLDRHAPTPQAA
jgi:D-threo-aldose 1-dehydrogenase